MYQMISQTTNLGIFGIYADVQMPTFATPGSACFDLKLYLSNNDDIEVWTDRNEKFIYNYGTESLITLAPGYRYKLPTGLIMDIVVGHHVELNIRSGTALKKGLNLVNGTGIVDSDYVEPVFILVQNTSKSIVTLEHGERFAQGKLVPNIGTTLIPCSHAPERKTEREGGFNSTGLM
jgi:dUTP pyrophosphatase